MRIVAAPVRHLAWRRPLSQSAFRSSSSSSAVPRIASSSFWHSIIPKAFRRPDDPVAVAEREKAKAKKSKDWNPATFFIVIALLIGSNAIQLISLRYDRLNFSRKTDAKIALLRETIERVRRGEDVDVERALGTGDAEQEKEWDQVISEIESDDSLWQSKHTNKPKKPTKNTPKPDQNPSSPDQPPPTDQFQAVSHHDAATRRPGFY